MRKLLLALAFCLSVSALYAQTTEKPQLLKYVISAPDGSLALTITDDTRDNFMNIKSEKDFYKFQLFDTESGNLAHTFYNKGNLKKIDKTKIASGNYKILVYTKSFIITSEIRITSSDPANSIAIIDDN